MIQMKQAIVKDMNKHRTSVLELEKLLKSKMRSSEENKTK